MIHVRFVPEADHGDCNLLQDHHEAIFFCYSHGLGKTLIFPNYACKWLGLKSLQMAQ